MERAFFHKLYTKEELYEQFLVHGDFSKLTNDELLLLGKEVSKNEIKYAFFAMGSWKVPGLDELPAMFFQHSWDQVGSSLCAW